MAAARRRFISRTQAEVLSGLGEVVTGRSAGYHEAPGHGVTLTDVAARLGELHGQVHGDLLALTAPVDEDVRYAEMP